MRHVGGLPGGGRPGEEEALRATRGITGQGLPPTQMPSTHLVPRLLAGRLLGSPALVVFCALLYPSQLRGSREAGGPRAALLRDRSAALGRTKQEQHQRPVPPTPLQGQTQWPRLLVTKGLQDTVNHPTPEPSLG